MQSDLSRLIEQKHKLGGRIFEHYEFGEGWEKKKWMRWKTFKEKQATILMLEAKYWSTTKSYIQNTFEHHY